MLQAEWPLRGLFPAYSMGINLIPALKIYYLMKIAKKNSEKNREKRQLQTKKHVGVSYTMLNVSH